MKRWLLAYALTAVIFAAIDVVWIITVAQRQYQSQIGHLLAASPNPARGRTVLSHLRRRDSALRSPAGPVARLHAAADCCRCIVRLLHVLHLGADGAGRAQGFPGGDRRDGHRLGCRSLRVGHVAHCCRSPQNSPGWHCRVGLVLLGLSVPGSRLDVWNTPPP